jgi:hypothetical protein
MKNIHLLSGLVLMSLASAAFAGPTVTISGPSPNIPAIVSIGSANYVYTLHNYVPISMPLTINGVSAPVTEANGCSNTLPPGTPSSPSSCTVTVTINPTITEAGNSYNQILTIGYEGRAPFQEEIAFSVASLSSIAVTPANQTITVGDTEIYTATGTYSDSTTRNLTSNVTWTSSDSSVATINASGVATGLAPTSTTIGATYGDVQGSTTLTVSPPLLYLAAGDNSNNYAITLQSSVSGSASSWQSSYTQATSPSSFVAMSCNSLFCVAGGTKSGSILGEYSNSMRTSWSPFVPPGSPSLLLGVNCTDTYCIMVGESTDSKAYIIKSVNGSEWSQMSLGSFSDHAKLNSVYCQGSTCFAVGEDNKTAQNLLILTSTDSGSNWSQVSAGSIDIGYLSGVTYSGAKWIAVGKDTFNVKPVMLYSSDATGSSWSQGGGLAGDLSGYLNGVSCIHSNNCIAVGHLQATLGQALIVQSVDGGHWTQQSLATPWSTDDITLNGITCNDEPLCITVGYDLTLGSNPTTNYPFIGYGNGSSSNWQRATITGLSTGILNAVSF